MADYIFNMDGEWERTFSGEGVFYVYVLRRPNGDPFYVGKGKKKRIDDHEREARRGCTCHKCKVIRKIWRNGGEIGKDIVFRTNDERQALKHEALLIQQYREQLTNVAEYDERLKMRYRAPHKKKRQTAKQRYLERGATAQAAIYDLESQLRYAYLMRDYDEQARIIDTIAAYRAWIRPPRQERLDFDDE